MWPLPGRITNLTLLFVLLLVFATGFGALATGSAQGRWLVIAHGIVAMMIVLLIPWKSRVIRRGLRRDRRGRWVSLLLAVLVVVTLLTGLGYATGAVRFVGGTRGMWLHIAAALVLAAPAIWHFLVRPARPRRADLSRRTLVRLTAVAAGAAGLYVTTASVVRLAGLPGARRRFTGSYEAGSFLPDSMPETIWLNDSVPAIDPERWRLVVADAAGRRELTLAQLSAFDVRLRATLDCTSGWYAEQDWAGIPVSALLRDVGDARSLLVRSVTGYWVRFPIGDIDHLLLATRAGGAPLSPGHGHPVRLIAPGRRGFWWVKWVSRVETQSAPWWWQPPFPAT